ncbi:hypothetical protein B0H14DRAFT_2579933 [Mycena olivaceomarginata]|nr:hypothetical protein B0H14DRAFT_2579933 [Mycena olivaceomarginata]
MAPQIRLPAVEQEEKILPAGVIVLASPLWLSFLPTVRWTVRGQVVLQLAWHGPSRTYADPPPASRWTVGGQVVQWLACPGPSRTYAIHPPAHALQAAYLRQSVGLLEGRSSAARPRGCLYTIYIPYSPPLFLRAALGLSGNPRMRKEKLHPIPMSLAPGEDEKFWVLGRGPHAAIEMRKENPRRKDTGREGKYRSSPIRH